MKKRIVTLLCTAVFAMVLTTAPAMASGGPFYPISVEEYTYGPLDELRVSKVYQLSLSDDPSGIPTEDFERNGRHYYLLDMVKEDEVGVDTKDHSEPVTMDSDTKDLSAILKKLDPHKEVTTEDGYTGLLALDYTSVEVKAKGYKTATRSLSATRTYPSLSDADVSLIPQTITDSGKTLTLADVQWANDGTYYIATASYTGTSSNRYATGYTVTANYTGQVTKTECSVIQYTAIFGSEELLKEEPDAEESSQPETQAPDAASSAASPEIGMLIVQIMSCAGSVLTLVGLIVWGVQAKKGRLKT